MSSPHTLLLASSFVIGTVASLIAMGKLARWMQERDIKRAIHNGWLDEEEEL